MFCAKMAASPTSFLLAPVSFWLDLPLCKLLLVRSLVLLCFFAVVVVVAVGFSLGMFQITVHNWIKMCVNYVKSPA